MLHAAWKHAVIRTLALALLVTGLPAGAVAHAASPAVTTTAPAALVDGTIVYGVAGTSPAAEGWIYAELPGQPRFELARGARPIVSDDGRWLAFKRGNPVNLNAAQLWLLDLATGQEYDVTSSLEPPIWRVIGYSFSRDGKRLLLDYNNGLYTYDLVAPGGAPEWITGHGDLKAPAEAPDGAIWYSGDIGLFTVPGHQRQPETYNDAGFPRPSSTGRLVAYQSIRTPSGNNVGWDPWSRGNIAIWDADAPGYPGRPKNTAFTNVTESGNGVVGPVQWARDDSAVLAAAQVEGVGGLWQFAIGAGSELFGQQMPIAQDAVTLGGQVGGFSPGPLPQDDWAGSKEPGDTVTVRILDNDLGAGSSNKDDWLVTVDGVGLEGDLEVTGSGGAIEVVYTISGLDGGVVSIPYQVCLSDGFPLCGTATLRIDVRHPTTALELTVNGPTDGQVATRAQFEYAVELTNLGGEAEHADQRAVDVEFVLQLPDGVGYGGVQGGSNSSFDACVIRAFDLSDGRGSRFRNDLTCRASSLPAGGTIASTIVLIAPPVPVTRELFAYASAANVESAGGWDGTLRVQGERGSPQVAIASNLNPAAEGSDITYTVTVAGLGADASTGAADIVPTGQVVVFIDGDLYEDMGDIWLSDGSVDIYFYADLAPGPHEVTARYLGDDSYRAADSPPLTQVIGHSGPDLAVTMTHSDPFTAGRTGTYTVTVTNNGTADADAGGVLDLSFPPGISHLGQAISGDFTCVWKPIFTGNPDERHECSLAGAHTAYEVGRTYTLVVTVAIAPDAVAGVASARIFDEHDIDLDNNEVYDPTRIRQPAGVGGLDLVFGGPASLPAGQSAPFEGLVVNDGETDVPGPITTTLLVPDGKSAGRSLTAGQPTGTGWTCEKFRVGGRTAATCVHRGGVPAGGSLPPLAFPLAAPATAVPATAVLSYQVRGADGSTVAQLPTYSLKVAPPAAPHLAMQLTGSGALSTTGDAFTIAVANDGTGPTTGATTVTMPLPTTVSVTDIVSTGWTCTHGTDLRCVTDQRIAPGEAGPPVLVFLAGSPGRSGQSVTLTATATGTLGTELGSAAKVVTLPRAAKVRLEVQRTAAQTQPDGQVAYSLAVRNIGEGAAGSALTVVETLPLGFTATLAGDGAGWVCDQRAVTLTCTRPGDTQVLGAGAQTPPVSVVLAPFTGFVGTVIIGGHASVDTPDGETEHSSSGTIGLTLATSAQARARVDVSVTPGQTPLQRLGTTSASLQLANRGTRATDEPTVGVFLLPAGVSFAPGAAGISTGPYAIPSSGTATARPVGPTNPAGLSCTRVDEPAALVCLTPPGLAVNLGYRHEVQLVIAATAASEVAVVTGTMAVSAVGQAALDQAVNRLRARGRSALADVGEAFVRVGGFTPDAGPAQRLDAFTPDENGTPALSRVVLDASATKGEGRQLTYGWTQTMGPAVTWEGAAAGSQPGAGSALSAFPAATTFAPAGAAPQAWGVRPAFTLRATGPEPVTLGFRLYVTDGAAVRTADTTVTLTPGAPAAPRPPQVCIRDLSGGGAVADAPCWDPSAPPPAAGTPMMVGPLTPYTHDADGKAVRWSWAAIRPAEVPLTFTPDIGSRDGSQVRFTWPTGVSQLALVAAVTNGSRDVQGRPLVGHVSAVAGPDATPLGLRVLPLAGPAIAGAPVTVVAEVENGSFGNDELEVRWRQLAGPDAGLGTDGRTGESVTFTGPAPRWIGDVATFEVTARRGAGSAAAVATALLTVPLAATPTPGLVVTDLGSLRVDPGAKLKLAATGTGVGTVSYAWKVLSGGGSLDDAQTATPTYTAPASEALATLSVTVTDSAGATVSQAVPVRVGAKPASTDTSASANPCDSRMPLGILFSLLGQGRKPQLTVGNFAIDLGQLPSAIGQSCEANVAVAFTGASASLGPLTLANLEGSLDRYGLTLSAGEVALPHDWKLAPIQIGAEPITVSFGSGAALTGSLRWRNQLPWLSVPASASNVLTTITLGTEQLVVDAKADVAGGNASVTATVPLAGASFTATVILDKLSVFKTQVNGSGTITRDSRGVTYDVRATIGQRVLGPGFTFTGGELTWNGDGLHFSGEAITAKDALGVHLAGDYQDSDNWAATASVTMRRDPVWMPAGLSIASGSQLGGSVSSVKGTVNVDIGLAVTGEWAIPGTRTTLTGLTARFANAEAPGTCPAVPKGDVWLAVSGTAALALPGHAGTKPLRLAVTSCVVPGSGDFVVTSTGNFQHYQPLSGVDLTIENVALTVSRTGAGTSAVIGGNLRAFGAAMGARLVMLPDATGFMVIADADLSDLGLPLPRGHLIYSSAPVANLAAIPGLASGTGSLGESLGTSLAGLAVPEGFTGLSNFRLPDSLSVFLADKLGLPKGSSLLVRVDLGESPTITGKLSAGPGGITLFTTESGTALALNSVNLRISMNGSFGIGGEATLSMKQPEAGGAAVAPSCADGSTTKMCVTLGAELALNLAGATPSASIALYKTGAVWNDAFGITGLGLGNLAIQGGVSFTAPPTPTIGFGATITSLPASFADALKIQPLAGGGYEPMTFVVNLSASNPIFDLTLGVADGHHFLQPGPGLGIDVASLVIAPMGGSVGPFTYSPGLHLQFDANLLGTSVAVQADATVSPPSLSAHAEVGAIDVAGVLALRRTVFDLDVGPTGLQMAFSGGLDMPGGASLEAQATVTATATSGLHFEVAASGNAIGLGPAFELESVRLEASGGIGALEMVPSLSLRATATANVLGTRPVLTGSVTLVPGLGLTAGELYAASSPIRLGAATIGGNGCRLRPELGTTGLCIGVGFNLLSATPVTVDVSGSLAVSGLTAEFDGTLDGTGLRLDGQLALTSTASVQVNGRLYFGDKLAGVKDLGAPVGSGTRPQVQVKAGDFRLVSAGSLTLPLAGFAVNAEVDAGNVGGQQWAKAEGHVAVLDSSVHVAGQFARTAGTFTWQLDGFGQLTVSGYRVADANVTLSSDGYAAVSGKLSLGKVSSTSFTGTVRTTTGRVVYTLSGRSNLDVLGVTLGATAEIGNTSGWTQATITAAGTVSTFARFNASATFDTKGEFCLQAVATVVGVNGTGTFCNPGGLTATFGYRGFNVSGSATSAGWALQSTTLGSFQRSGSLFVCDWSVSADWKYVLMVSSKNGVTLAGTGKGSAKCGVASLTAALAVGYDPWWVQGNFGVGPVDILARVDGSGVKVAVA